LLGGFLLLLMLSGLLTPASAQHTTTEHESGYGYFWWTDTERPGNFYALGNYGQYIYIAPQASTVIVRLGSDWGTRQRRLAEHLPHHHRPTRRPISSSDPSFLTLLLSLTGV